MSTVAVSPPTARQTMPRFGNAAALGVLFALLALLSLYDSRLFHILAELLCISIGAATFLVIWNARLHVEQGFFLVLGLAFLTAAGFDCLHLLAAAGLDALPIDIATEDGLWSAGRILLAATVCFGAWLLPNRNIRASTALLCVGGGGLLLVLAVTPFGQLVPARPTGPFDIRLALTGRLLPLLLFVAAAMGLWRNREHLAPSLVKLLLGSFSCLAVSGALIDLDAPAFSQVLGHLIKVLGYCLGCQAIVVTGIRRPYILLFKEIGRRELELQSRMVRLNAQARAIFDLSGTELLESGEFRGFAAILLRRAMGVLGVARAGVWMFSPDHDSLSCLLGTGLAQTDEGTQLESAAFPLYFQTIAHERVLVVDNAREAPLTRAFGEAYLAPRGIVSMLDAPFRLSGRLAGVLCLEHVGTPRRWSDDEQAFAGSMADMLSLALEAAERHRAANALAESEQRLRSLLDAMPDPVCFKDDHGRWIVANQAQIEAFGLEGTHWQGLTDAALAKHSTGDRRAFAVAAATDQQAWISRESSGFGMSLAPPGGPVRHFDVIKAPLFFRDGHPRGLVVLSRDVTAYREAMARLRESKEELEAIYNETSDGLVIADTATRTLIRVNAAACRMFGYRPPQLVALSLWDLHPGEDREKILSLFQEIAAGRLRLVENIPCRRNDGSVFYADISAQPITYASRPGILGFYRDITERRDAQEAVKASEDRFRKVFNSTYDAIIMHDADGSILDVNDKMLELFGVRREEAAGFSLEQDYSSADNPMRRLPEYWRAVMDGEERFFEWKARRPHDGSAFYVEAYLRRISLADRRVILANMRDVTEHKRVLAALAARQAEISALNRDLARRVREETEKNRQKDLLLLNQTRLAAMGEMIGNIAHQWRQPLNALSILLANMRLEYEDVCEDFGSLREAHRQADAILHKMSTTIDDFRNFFKPDRERQPFAVVEAIGEALLVLEASLAQHGITVHFVARHNPRVVGLHGEFSQVVLNLLGNAKDAILERKPARGLIAIRVMARLGQAVIHIRDNGGGISPKVMERMFDPYYTTKSERGGTGLGLYISKIIVEEHLKGTLGAANTDDGARLVIRIPLCP